MSVKTFFVLVLMLLVAFFSVQNAEMITVRFLHWQFVLSQALVILLAVFCGVIVGLTIGTLSGRRRRDRPKSETAAAPADTP